jgi:hypothetical protein
MDAEGSAFHGHVARFTHLLFLFRINKLHPNDAFARSIFDPTLHNDYIARYPGEVRPEAENGRRDPPEG